LRVPIGFRYSQIPGSTEEFVLMIHIAQRLRGYPVLADERVMTP
jgi:hypothetical protein